MTVGSLLRFGWEAFKRRGWFFVGAAFVIFLLYGAVGALTGIVDSAITDSAEGSSLLGSLINLLLSTLISMGVTNFYLVAHDNPDTVDLTPLWHPFPFWQYLAATILMGLAIAIGFVLLIVPGVILSVMLMFTTFIVVDRGLGPIGAMKLSSRITKGHRWMLFGFAFVLVLINLAGVLALGFGLLVTVPFTSLAFVHAYRLLSGRAGLAPHVQDAVL